MGRYPLLLILIVQLGIILCFDKSGINGAQQPPAYGQASYAAIIQTTREATTSGQLFVAEIDSVNNIKVPTFKARVHLLSETPQLYPGQRIKFSGTLRELPPVPPVPDVVDLLANMRRQSVTASIAIPDDSVKYIAPALHIKEYFARQNEFLLNRLKQSPLESSTIDILSALLLGRSEMLTSETRADYSAAGLSHVLALSGMHVAIISMIIAFALWPFYFTRHYKTRLFLTIVGLWYYAALTAFIPSVTRSVIMATVYMSGRILERKTSALNSLCLAAILILLINPEDIYAVGFQLSFAAVAGIILFYPLINRIDRRTHPHWYAMVSYPALSISAMILAAPVSTFHFHAFPLYFLFANLVIVPVVPLLIVSGVFSILFVRNFGADILCDAMNGIANFLASWPHAQIANLYPSFWSLMGLMAVLLLFAYASHKRNLFTQLACCILLFGGSICYLIYPKTTYPEKEIYIVEESRFTQTIVATHDSCIVYTTAVHPGDKAEIETRYELLLRDFTEKRNIPKPIVK